MTPLAPIPDPARRRGWPTWARLIAVLAAVAGASACVIGPKQDDPVTLDDERGAPDSAAPSSQDTGPGEQVDASTGTFNDASTADEAGSDAPAVPSDTAPSDTGCARGDASDAGETNCADDAGDAGDGGADAVTDG